MCLYPKDFIYGCGNLHFISFSCIVKHFFLNFFQHLSPCGSNKSSRFGQQPITCRPPPLPQSKWLKDGHCCCHGNTCRMQAQGKAVKGLGGGAVGRPSALRILGPATSAFPAPRPRPTKSTPASQQDACAPRKLEGDPEV